jgi:hypothetical protein
LEGVADLPSINFDFLIFMDALESEKGLSLFEGFDNVCGKFEYACFNPSSIDSGVFELILLRFIARSLKTVGVYFESELQLESLAAWDIF